MRQTFALLLASFSAAATAQDRAIEECAEFRKTDRTKLAAVYGSFDLKHGGGVTTLAFAPDGKSLASGGEDKLVRFWDAATGGCLRSFRGHFLSITAVAFSRDGKRLLSADGMNIKIWDSATGKELRSVPPSGCFPPYAVAFSPDEKLALGTMQNGAGLWDLETGTLARTLTCASPSHVAFSPDGRTAAAGERDGAIKLWDVGSGRESGTLSGHKSGLKSLSFLADGKRLISSSGDFTVRLWDLAGRKQLVMLGDDSPRLGLNTDRNPRNWAGVPPGRELIFSGVGNDFCVDRTTDGTWEGNGPLSPHNAPIAIGAFTSDGTRLATGSEDGTIRIWNVKDTGNLSAVAEPKGHSCDVRAVAVSPDGKWVASGGDDFRMRLWDAATGREVAVWSGQGNTTSLAFSRDGTALLRTGFSKQPVRLDEVPSGKPIHFLREDNVAVATPKGAAFAEGSTVIGLIDKKLTYWDWNSGEELKSHALDLEETERVSFAVSRNGRVAAIGAGANLHLWDVPGGRLLKKIEMGWKVYGVALSPDGSMVFSDHGDHFRVCDVASGKQLLKSFAHAAKTAAGAAFSPDGRFLVTAGGDRKIQIWMAGTWNRYDTIDLSSVHDIVRGLAFSADGKWFVAGSDRGLVYRFDLTIDESAFKKDAAEAEAKPRYEAGKALYDKKDYAGALKEFAAAVEKNPTSAAYRHYKATCHYLLKEYEKAIAEYDLELKIDVNCASSWLYRGYACWYLSRWEECVHDLRQAIQLKPSYQGECGKLLDETCAKAREARISKGDQLVKAKDYKGAAAEFEAAIALQPEEKEAWHKRGCARYWNGEHDKALADFDQVVKLDPRHANGRLMKGYAHYRLQQWSECVKAFKTAIRLDEKLQARIKKQLEEAEMKAEGK